MDKRVNVDRRESTIANIDMLGNAKLEKAINKVRVTDFDRKNWIKYLVIPDFYDKLREHTNTGNFGEQFGAVVEGNFGKQFEEVVETHVNAYLIDKKEPPSEIAAAIMNIGDDILDGREPVLRAGDYISIQNFIKNNGK